MSRHHVSVATLAAEYRIGNVKGTENMWDVLGLTPDLAKWNEPLSPSEEAAHRATLDEYVARRAQAKGVLFA